MDQRDRKRLVFVVTLVEHPDLAEVAGNGDAMSVVMENDAVLGGFVSVRTDFLTGGFHIPEGWIQQVLRVNLSFRREKRPNARARP